MIYSVVTKNNFIDAFKAISPSNFKYESLCALYDYLNSDIDIELDVIAICCDWCEYDITEAYNEFIGESDEDLTEDEMLDELEDMKTIIKTEISNIILVQE